MTPARSTTGSESNDVGGMLAHELLNQVGRNVSFDDILANFRRMTRCCLARDAVRRLD